MQSINAPYTHRQFSPPYRPPTPPNGKFNYYKPTDKTSYVAEKEEGANKNLKEDMIKRKIIKGHDGVTTTILPEGAYMVKMSVDRLKPLTQDGWVISENPICRGYLMCDGEWKKGITIKDVTQALEDYKICNAAQVLTIRSDQIDNNPFISLILNDTNKNIPKKNITISIKGYNFMFTCNSPVLKPKTLYISGLDFDYTHFTSKCYSYKNLLTKAEIDASNVISKKCWNAWPPYYYEILVRYPPQTFYIFKLGNSHFKLDDVRPTRLSTHKPWFIFVANNNNRKTKYASVYMTHGMDKLGIVVDMKDGVPDSEITNVSGNVLGYTQSNALNNFVKCILDEPDFEQQIVMKFDMIMTLLHTFEPTVILNLCDRLCRLTSSNKKTKDLLGKISNRDFLESCDILHNLNGEFIKYFDTRIKPLLPPI